MAVLRPKSRVRITGALASRSDNFSPPDRDVKLGERSCFPPAARHAATLPDRPSTCRAPSLTWDMVTDAEGNLGAALHLRDEASKGASGRVIPLNKELRTALQKLHDERSTSPFVITTERSQRTSASAIVNLFASWYRAADLQGCSSHSGRRTFITNAARTISTVGGSLRDVQMLAGHSALSTTQRYIEADAEAQRRVVEMV